jgi:hypothetical protein
VSLPGAEELFRQTGQASETADPTVEPPRRRTTNGQRPPQAPGSPGSSSPGSAPGPASGPRRTSGRVKHDEKMTVYVTADELLELEHARLRLRHEWGVGVDRGRVVREAIAIVLADVETRGAESDLVRRLSGP